MVEPRRAEVRNFATHVTAASIMLIGFGFLAAMVFLLFRGGTGNVLLALLLGLAGLAAVTGGFLFLLVPTKVDEIDDEAVAQDAPSRFE